MLADSIKAVGVLNPIVVRYDSGKVTLVDGESRLRAVKLALSEGAEIKSIPVITEAQHTSEEDRVASLLTRNTGKPLNFIERGDVFAKLIGYGWTEADIARKTGITGAHVNNIMQLHSAAPSVKKAVEAGKISPSLAVQQIRDHGKDAVKAINAAIEDANAAGKQKATAKNIKTKSKDKAKRDPLAFSRPEAKQMFAAMCDIYFTAEDRSQAMRICRNVFEDVVGSEWKAIATSYHKEINAE
jgi:ParB/RepB/Spo0J family partition protein